MKLTSRTLGATLSLTALVALSACSAAPAPQPKAAAAPQGAAQKVATSSVAALPAPAPLAPVVTPAGAPPMAALARRLAMVIDGAKPQVTTFPIDLTALPRTTMHAALDAKEAAKLDRSKLTEDPDLTVKPAEGYSRQYMLAFSFKDLSKVAFAHVRVTGQYGVNDGWFGEGFGGVMNTYMTCGGAAELVPVHWETVQMEKDQVSYTASEGVLDRQACRILSVRKSTAKAKPLLPKGILFGFRSCEGSCTEKEELTLLFPRASASAAGALGGGADRASGSFSIVSFPIQKGGGGAFMARVLRRDVVAWQLRSDQPETDKTTPVSPDAARMGTAYLPTFELGVEVSQTNDDDAPVAIAYMDIDPATLPPPPAAPATPNAAKTSAVPVTTSSPAPSRIGFLTDPFAVRR